MRQLFDCIRQIWVAATPEEIIRQTWIQRMIEELQFPKELIAVEKDLKTLPHLQDPQPLPSRRIDILCFRKDHDTFQPLLLIVSKQTPLTQEVLDQAIAYNHYVTAPYVAVVNASEVRFRYQLACHSCEISRLPMFPELVEAFDG